MKAVTFESELRADQVLSVPTDVVDRIPRGQSLRVFVLIPESNDDQAWEELAASEFGMGYAASDAIYDELSNR